MWPIIFMTIAVLDFGIAGWCSSVQRDNYDASGFGCAGVMLSIAALGSSGAWDLWPSVVGLAVFVFTFGNILANHWLDSRY